MDGKDLFKGKVLIEVRLTLDVNYLRFVLRTLITILIFAVVEHNHFTRLISCCFLHLQRKRKTASSLTT